MQAVKQEEKEAGLADIGDSGMWRGGKRGRRESRRRRYLHRELVEEWIERYCKPLCEGSKMNQKIPILHGHLT